MYDVCLIKKYVCELLQKSEFTFDIKWLDDRVHWKPLQNDNATSKWVDLKQPQNTSLQQH